MMPAEKKPQSGERHRCGGPETGQSFMPAEAGCLKGSKKGSGHDETGARREALRPNNKEHQRKETLTPSIISVKDVFLPFFYGVGMIN